MWHFDLGEAVDLIRECPICAVAAIFLITFGATVFWFIIN